MLTEFSLSGGTTGGRLLPEAHGGADGGAGLVGIIDKLLAAISDFLSSGPGPGGGGGGLFEGIAVLGWNVHPILVHFPIAFLVAFFVLEIIAVSTKNAWLRQLASGMLYLGAVGAVLAVIAGLVAASIVPHGEKVHEIMEWHESLGITVAILSVSLAAWRFFAKAVFCAMAQALHFSIAAIILICITFGADLGGEMVYEYGVGVKNLQQTDAAYQHHHESKALRQDVPATPPQPIAAQPTPPPAESTEPTTPVPAAPSVATPDLASPAKSADEHQQHHHHHHRGSAQP